MINPGTLPVADATEAAAAANMAAFVAAVFERGSELAGDPVRDPQADRDGRYGFLMPVAGGSTVRVLMPGAELRQVRDDLTATAPCPYISDVAWWWPSAVIQAASATARPAVAQPDCQVGVDTRS